MDSGAVVLVVGEGSQHGIVGIYRRGGWHRVYDQNRLPMVAEQGRGHPKTRAGTGATSPSIGNRCAQAPRRVGGNLRHRRHRVTKKAALCVGFAGAYTVLPDRQPSQILKSVSPPRSLRLIDLLTVTPITQRFLVEAAATDRVQVVAADVVNTPVPGTYDVAVLRSFLQVLSPQDAAQALQHIGAALHPGGRLYIVGRILDDSRLAPVDTVGFNVVFLNIFDEGRAYTEGEHRTSQVQGVRLN